MESKNSNLLLFNELNPQFYSAGFNDSLTNHNLGMTHQQIMMSDSEKIDNYLSQFDHIVHQTVQSANVDLPNNDDSLGNNNNNIKTGSNTFANDNSSNSCNDKVSEFVSSLQLEKCLNGSSSLKLNDYKNFINVNYQNTVPYNPLTLSNINVDWKNIASQKNTKNFTQNEITFSNVSNSPNDNSSFLSRSDYSTTSMSSLSSSCLRTSSCEEQTDLSTECNINLQHVAMPIRGNNNISTEEVKSTSQNELSLVQQLHNDQPLLNAIAVNKKRGSYRCAHCPKTFLNIFDYAAHMDSYNINREYKCPFALCPWKILGLPRRSDLRRHCAIQHKHELPNDLKEYLNLKDETYPTIKCSNKICGKTFYRRDAYNRHVNIVHGTKDSRFNRRVQSLLADCPQFGDEQSKIEYIRTALKRKSKSKRITS